MPIVFFIKGIIGIIVKKMANHSIRLPGHLSFLMKMIPATWPTATHTPTRTCNTIYKVWLQTQLGQCTVK